jgi:hypothetical protein
MAVEDHGQPTIRPACPLSTFKDLTEVDANANMPAQLGQIVRGAEQRGGHQPWSHTADED